MRSKTLLERLRDPAADAERGGEGLEAVADSILRHLQRMLNCRHGHALTVPDYGVPDLTEVARAFPDSMPAMEEALRHSIERYEPRLRDVTVRFSEDEEETLTLSFEISARLVTEDEDAGVWFMTRIEPDGRVVVRG